MFCVVHPGKAMVLQVAIQVLPGRMVAEIHGIWSRVFFVNEGVHGRADVRGVLVPGVLAMDGDDPAGGLAAPLHWALRLLLFPVDEVFGDVV